MASKRRISYKTYMKDSGQTVRIMTQKKKRDRRTESGMTRIKTKTLKELLTRRRKETQVGGRRRERKGRRRERKKEKKDEKDKGVTETEEEA